MVEDWWPSGRHIHRSVHATFMSVKEGTRQVGTRKTEASPRLGLRFAPGHIHYVATIGLPFCANTATTAMHVPPLGLMWATNLNSKGSSPGEVLPLCWVIWKCCCLTPFLTFWGLNTIFLGYCFSSTNTKTIFWGTKTTNPYRIWSFWTQIPFFPSIFLGAIFSFSVFELSIPQGQQFTMPGPMRPEISQTFTILNTFKLYSDHCIHGPV